MPGGWQERVKRALRLILDALALDGLSSCGEYQAAEQKDNQKDHPLYRDGHFLAFRPLA